MHLLSNWVILNIFIWIKVITNCQENHPDVSVWITKHHRTPMVAEVPVFFFFDVCVSTHPRDDGGRPVGHQQQGEEHQEEGPHDEEPCLCSGALQAKKWGWQSGDGGGGDDGTLLHVDRVTDATEERPPNSTRRRAGRRFIKPTHRAPHPTKKTHCDSLPPASPHRGDVNRPR